MPRFQPQLAVDGEEVDLKAFVAVEAVAQIVAGGHLVAAEVLLSLMACVAQALVSRTQCLLKTPPNGIHRCQTVHLAVGISQ